MIQFARRGFLLGLIASPAIVHAGNLMPISVSRRRNRFMLLDMRAGEYIGTHHSRDEYCRRFIEPAYHSYVLEVCELA